MRWPKMYQSLLLLAMFAVACLIGCGQVNSPEEGGAQTTGRLQVVATTAMVADIVRQVAGDRADVTSLMKEGVDPHLYQPRRGDVVQLEAADMIFYNGLRLEGKMTDVLARLATSGRPVIAVAESIAELLEEVIENQTHVDPHVWMDVMRWSVAVDVAAEALAEHDPDHAESYRSNALQYKAAVKALDEYVRNAVATIPQQQRLLVTAHDAFGYFGDAYGIEVRGIQGISTESEAGVRDINDLIDLLISRNVQAVFVETSVADRNVKALIEGTASRGYALTIGGSLFSDAMGAAGTYEGTYIGMIDHNATVIVRALGGEAPALGMEGRLTP